MTARSFGDRRLSCTSPTYLFLRADEGEPERTDDRRDVVQAAHWHRGPRISVAWLRTPYVLEFASLTNRQPSGCWTSMTVTNHVEAIRLPPLPRGITRHLMWRPLRSSGGSRLQLSLAKLLRVATSGHPNHMVHRAITLCTTSATECGDEREAPRTVLPSPRRQRPPTTLDASVPAVPQRSWSTATPRRWRHLRSRRSSRQRFPDCYLVGRSPFRLAGWGPGQVMPTASKLVSMAPIFSACSAGGRARNSVRALATTPRRLSLNWDVRDRRCVNAR
jgi:hypothetical protein